MIWAFGLFAGCQQTSIGGAQLVRGGLITPVGPGQVLADGRFFVERSWKPGEAVEGEVAPKLAGCAQLFVVPLGDVSGLIAAGGEPPDTALAFSPDGQWLAIGAWTGEVLVVNAWTGAERARSHVAEGMVKQVIWSEDGSVLYAAEQSPDAYVYALDPVDLHDRGRLRMADEIGTSPAPGPDDPFGAYSLPGAYGLALVEGGLLVAGSHGWTEDGERKNRSRIWLLDPELHVVSAWPAQGPADAVIGGFDTTKLRVALSLRRSAAGPSSMPDLPIDGIQILDIPTLSSRAQIRITPLAPLYSGVFVGDALRLRGDEVWVGTGDGRVLKASAETGEILATRNLGTPFSSGLVPIAATVGWIDPQQAGNVLAVTTRTAIPYGAASPDLKPPGLHPAENGIWELAGEDLATGWNWQGPWTLQGLVQAGDWVVVGAGERSGDDRRDLFGALVFDLSSPPADRLAAICSTPSPVFFRPALSPDGRVAVAESPFRVGQGVEGEYRVSVWR